MRPELSAHDMADRRLAQIVLTSKFCLPDALLEVCVKKLPNLLFGEFRSTIPLSSSLMRMGVPTMLLTRRVVASSSTLSILSIVFLRAEVKMTWVHAARIVALMKHEHTFWNFSAMNTPRNTVRPIPTTISYCELTVTILPLCRSLPLPALVRRTDLHLFPEPLHQITTLSLMFAHIGQTFTCFQVSRRTMRATAARDVLYLLANSMRLP